MSDVFPWPEPSLSPPLDPDFRPPALAHREFLRKVERAGGGPLLVIVLVRPDGSRSRYATRLLPDGHPDEAENLFIAERMFKFLLWQRGGAAAWISAPPAVGSHLQRAYSPGGSRRFDDHFMGTEVYGRPFSITLRAEADLPAENETSRLLGRHLDGCRLGFDLGASDRKVAAVQEGQPTFTREVIWEPKKQSDPEYHYREIVAGLEEAAAHLPRLDAIGGSAAGIYLHNQVRVASLFRAVPKERYGEVRSLFSRVQSHFGVPLEVINDGEVSALAGSMSLEEGRVLGIAMGSSQAAGYVTAEGSITDWLNELAFVPVDYQPRAPVEEWSGDRGVGALYFSQQCVFRLAPKAGIAVDADLPDAEKLKWVQALLEGNHPGARAIWETMGIYLGYTLALYDSYYSLHHVLLMGRCTSGQGGAILAEKAKSVLQAEFPEIAQRIHLQLPSEKSRRIGQAVAAASLPEIGKTGRSR